MRSIPACLKVCTAPHTSFLFHPSHSVTHKCTLTLDLKCLKESCACRQVHNRSDPSIVSHSHCAGQQGKKNVLKWQRDVEKQFMQKGRSDGQMGIGKGVRLQVGRIGWREVLLHCRTNPAACTLFSGLLICD